MSQTLSAPDSMLYQRSAAENKRRRFFLLLYMMRVPVLILLLLGVGLPVGFSTSMLHGLADIQPRQVFSISFSAVLLVSAAITCAFLVLLYGEQRADGHPGLQTRAVHVSKATIIALYVFGALAYLALFGTLYIHMRSSDPSAPVSITSFLGRMMLGLLFASVVILVVFWLVLRVARPPGDDAVQVFVAPLLFVIRGRVPQVDSKIRKTAAPPAGADTGYASHRGPVSSFLARLLGPGYCAYEPGKPALYPGHRFAAFSALAFLVLYLYAGSGVYRELAHAAPRGAGSQHLGSVLNDVLLLLTFWCWLLSGMTFLLDRFRIPLIVTLGLVLYATAWIGPSDHFFDTVGLPGGSLRPPAQAFAEAPDHIVLVAAAGGGIQSAAWVAEVLCNLRTELRPDFAKSVLAVSGVSGGSVGTMFYLRCLEAAPDDASPAEWAARSSLEAVGWGLAYPDLWRALFPPARWFLKADRGWALERALIQNARFSRAGQHLADERSHGQWPVLLLNSTLSESGDPIVFTNSAFPAASPAQELHGLRGFHAEYPGEDVALETAARMSAAFPYVSPAARPGSTAHLEHFADGGYFDNSGLFSLGQWLKAAADTPEAASAPRKKILLLEIDAFPDFGPKAAQKKKSWYFQLLQPLETILNVRSESQVIRDETSGKDLQELLRGRGYETTFLTVRYVPSAASSHLPTSYLDKLSGKRAVECPGNPPLSWHLTPLEQVCIQGGWRALLEPVTQVTREFFERRAPMEISDPSQCDDQGSNVLLGVQVRRCSGSSRPLPPSKR
jgi:hypothetical protein